MSDCAYLRLLAIVFRYGPNSTCLAGYAAVDAGLGLWSTLTTSSSGGCEPENPPFEVPATISYPCGLNGTSVPSIMWFVDSR